MLNMEEWMEVKDLHRQGHSIRQICRLTGYSRNTVRKVKDGRRSFQPTITELLQSALSETELFI